MRQTLLFTIIIFVTLSAFGQTFKRQNGETAEMFASRFKPDSTQLAHTVIETTSLVPNKKVIIAFYKKTIHQVQQMKTYDDHSQYDIIIGYLYVPIGENNFRRQLIDTIQPNGGDPEILSVFFANADKNQKKELIVLCKQEQQHYDYNGAFYDTYIYDYFNGQIKYLKKESEKFYGCDCRWRNGRTEKAKYKTANEVKAALVKMGYNQ